MSKIVLLKSLAKEYLSLKYASRRNNTYKSATKIIIVSFFLVTVAGLYAVMVTSASTMGYFFEQENQKLDALNFEKSIQKLEVIRAEKKIWTDMNLHRHYSWFEGHGSNMVTIDAYSREFVKK